MTAFGDQTGLLRRYVWRYFDGLTDDELHWEPVPAMWGLRRIEDLRTPCPDDVIGDWWMDSVRPRPNPEPLTTIGWRIGHLTLGTFNWISSLDARGPRDEPPLAGDVATLLPLWRSVFDEVVELVSSYSEDELAEEVVAGTSRLRRSWIASHMTLEIAAHGAEVGTMRHLYREMHADR